MTNARHGIDWDKAQALMAAERDTFINRMPRSRALSADRGRPPVCSACRCTG